MKLRLFATIVLLLSIFSLAQAQTSPQLIEVKHHKAHKATKHKMAHHPHKHKAHAT